MGECPAGSATIARAGDQAYFPGMSETRTVGRPAEFRPDEALLAAMRLFWERGFEATSIGDLEDCTGLGRSSIYNAFGMKRQFYLKALSVYLERLGEFMFSPLENGNGGLEDVHAFFERLRNGLAKGLGAPPSARGCMLVNGMIESAGSDPELSLLSEEFCRRFQSSMSTALERAAGQRQIRGEGIDTKTRLLLAIALGVNVTSRSGAPPEEIGALVNAAHDLVNAWRTPLPSD